MKNRILGENWHWKIVLTLFFFAFAYSYYAVVSYTDLFYEVQFLHTDFLAGLIQKNLDLRTIVTTFGEHLVIGYNLVLAANYYLATLWAGFDAVVSVVCTIAIATLVVSSCGKVSGLSDLRKFILSISSILLLLSVTNNVAYGMWLSASIGVLLFVAGMYSLQANFQSSANVPMSQSLKVYFLLYIASVFFLGVNIDMETKV